jgi:hypothetical protein
MKGSSMRLFTLRSSFLWAVLAVVPACSDDSNPNPNPYPTPTPDGSTTTPDGSTTTPDGETPEPDGGTSDTGTRPDGNVDAMCDEYAVLECTRDKACFPIFVDWNYGSYDACLAQTKETCRVWSALPGSSLTAQRLLGCSRAYAATGCDAPGPFAECVFVPGDLANGGGCLLNDQCSSGHCRKEGINDCGACADKLPEGAACSYAAECQTARCSAGHCEPILKEGQTCTESSDCLRDLVCFEDICQRVTLVGEGDLCGGAVQCRASLSCVSGRCFKDMIVEAGQKCGEMPDVGFAFCRNGDCNKQSICVNRPALGSACSDEGSCAGTAVCIQGQCRALASDICDIAPRNVGARADAIDRAPLMGRPLRACSGRAQRSGG